jgi:hypothetical protein
MAGSAATNGFDIVIELNEFALTTGLRASGRIPTAVVRPLSPALGRPGMLSLTFQAPSVFLDMPPGTPGPPGQVAVLVPFVGSSLTLSRVAGVTGAFTFFLEGTMLFGQPPVARAVPGLPGFTEIVLDYTGSIGRTDVTFSPRSTQAITDELLDNNVPTGSVPTGIAEVRQVLDEALRIFLKSVLKTVPLTAPPGVAVVPPAPMGPPFTPTLLDVAVVDDPTPAGRDALLILIRTCGPGPLGPAPKRTAFTSASAPPGAPIGVMVANWPILHCALIPALVAALGPLGLTAGDFSPTAPCALAGPVGLTLPGGTTVTLTALTGTVSPPTGIVVTASITKRTLAYTANATIRIPMTFTLTTPAGGGGQVITPAFGTPAVTASFNLSAWAYLIGGPFIAGFFQITAVVTTVLTIALTDALVDVVITGVLNRLAGGITGTAAGPPIPLGAGLAGIRINSLAFDDLVIGGEPIVAPTPARELEVVDAVGTPIDVVGPGVQPPAGSLELFGLFVLNRVDHPVTIQQVALFDPDGAFTVGHRHGFPVTVAAQSRNALTCAFHPRTEGSHVATVSLFTTDAAHPALTVTLTGQAGPSPPRPQIALDRAAIDYGMRLVGTSASEHLTVTNVGDRDGSLQIVIVDEQPTGQFPASAAPAAPIAPGQSAVVELRFAPTTRGAAAATARLTLTGTGGTDSGDVALTGRAGSPVLVLDPPALLDFGVLQPGQPATRSLVIRNDGDLPLEVSGLVPVAGLGFTVDPAQAFPVIVAPGAQGSVPLIPFGAAVLGTLYAEFDVFSNDPSHASSPPRLVVVGTIAGPRIRYTDYLDLGVAATAPRSGRVTIENIGTADLEIQNVLQQAAPVFTLPGQPREFTVAPGDQHAVTIEFAPDKPGAYGATLTLQTNVPGQATIHIGIVATLA